MKINEVEISNPDKLIFPDQDITKLDLINYYEKIADEMLPYLKDRPLTLQRFPDGVDSKGFFQKNASDYFPDYIETISIKTEDGSNTQVICNSKKSLIYLANQGTITFHIWLSKKDTLHHPDKVVFDLDPPKDAFEKVKEAAKITFDFLEAEGKKPKLMTTGKSGFHVWYPIDTNKKFDNQRDEAKTIASKLEEKHPDVLTTATRKEKRDNKVFVDYLRNAYGQTSVCPFSLRPNSTAGVATPIERSELSKIDKADYYNYRNIFRRLSQKN